jgi:hypothetical protein
MRLSIFLIFCISILSISSYSQCAVPLTLNCDGLTSNMLPEPGNTPDVIFYFDNFAKYSGGITIFGSTVLKLKIDESVVGACKWKLQMTISNNGWVGPVDQWNTLATYGLGDGSGNPTINMLGIRVSNYCQTSPIDNAWQYFTNTTDAPIAIIDPGIGVRNPSGPCGGSGEVNGPGSYLGSNYGEYSFYIDYQIIPGFSFKAGNHQLKLNFCLVEY